MKIVGIAFFVFVSIIAFSSSFTVQVLLSKQAALFQHRKSPLIRSRSTQFSSSIAFAKKKWDRESLSSSDDAFAEDDDVVIINESSSTLSDGADKGLERKEKKKKMRLEPETVFFEGPPSLSEVVLPAISILTVIGIVPFVAAVARQIWVRYKFTSRRISIQSGIGGSTQTEVIYPEVQEMRFAFRGFGASGDMVLFLKDGAKVELRHVPKFQEVYNFVLSKCDDDCQQKSMKIPKNN